MKREFAAPIAASLGILVLVLIAFVAWLFNWDLQRLPSLVALAGIVAIAGVVIFIAKKITHLFP